MPTSQPTARVAVITGSPNDLPTVEKAIEVLDSLGIASELRVLSAHRTPHETVRYVEDAEKRGTEIFIACAGMANHLAGVVAAHTLKPVIGVPLGSPNLAGLDSLLSTVQMPPGVPVATVAVDGTKNAAFLAARILGLTDATIVDRLTALRNKDKERYDI
ncbi:MAG: 5-(carboxyamino)imidazole ribonucleotide mutase [Thermoanaerobaculia bacterium]|nr:5-(carboxyamino)imidazole ribonucleotide mutase [Thermoanaerobaculia bacterium]